VRLLPETSETFFAIGKRATLSRCDRSMKASAAPQGTPWLWTLAYGQHKDRTLTHGYEATREAAMAAFAKSWRRE
jgi:hypothetical protein